MKPKKKTPTSIKKTSKKPIGNKPIMLIDKTVVTTKEKTHNTIQDPIQIKDLKGPPRSARNHPTRLSYAGKLKQCNLSPFSSPGASSFSPRYRKTLSPRVMEEKEKKKGKPKPTIQQQKCLEKKKGQVQKENKAKNDQRGMQLCLSKPPIEKTQLKKITQMSQQSSSSITKFNKLNLNIHLPKDRRDFSIGKNKIVKIRELKRKIEEKYHRELPSLKSFQLNFFCSIVLIQRLWRQHRIKKFINEFISPRSNPSYNITGDLCGEQKTSRLDITVTTEAQTSQLIRKYHNLSYCSDKKKEIIEPEIRSTQINSAQKKINLKELELSSQLTPQDQTKMIKFVQCLRDITFHKPEKSKRTTKMNVFNLQESLSDKCLMQSFYSKVFKASPSKMNNFDVFRSKKQEKNLQRSIQLINSINSPQKADMVVIEQRFETELQSEENIQVKPLPVQTAEISVQTDNLLLPQQTNKEINSLKQLSNLSENVIFYLLNEFCEQFHGFTSKNILKKKKKAGLPGLKVTESTIRQYLTGLTTYMVSNHQIEVVRRFSLINPISFLKIHHEYDDQDDYMEEDEEINLPIIPNTLFYEYQLMYEAEKFNISQQDKKFSNFLQSLIKIHNLLLANCLSEMLQKTRIDRILFPWDNKCDLNRHKKNKFDNQLLSNELSKIINNICCSSFMRVGQFHKRIDDILQQEKLLKSISMEYKMEGNDWSAQYQYLELRLELTKYVEHMVLDEVIKELIIFI